MAEYRYNTKHYCGQRLSLTSPVQKGGISATCTNCGKRAWLKRVKGEFNPDHKCDVRCTSAHGNKCVCACGGANHGRDHGIATVVAVGDSLGHAGSSPATHRSIAVTRERMAAEMRSVPTAREKQFLGEIGKYITGDVVVRANHPIRDDRYLISFRTDDGDGIKWFVPDQYAPDWEIGKRLKIRAKVKAHEDHPQYGKATIVTYVEEIS